jgi:hypothetical protein
LILSLGSHSLSLSCCSSELCHNDEGQHEDDHAAHQLQGVRLAAQERVGIAII